MPQIRIREYSAAAKILNLHWDLRNCADAPGVPTWEAGPPVSKVTYPQMAEHMTGRATRGSPDCGLTVEEDPHTPPSIKETGGMRFDEFRIMGIVFLTQT